jgi:hypothetical protein
MNAFPRPNEKEMRRAEAATWDPKQPAARGVKISNSGNIAIRPAQCGVFSAEMPFRHRDTGIRLMIGPKGSRFIGMPDTKGRDADDRLVLNEQCKPIYDRLIDSRNRETRDKFCSAILNSLRAEYPKLFEGEPAQ